MSIREDEKLQRLENKKCLTELIQQYFKGKYESLNKIYQDQANMVLIDSEEIEGLRKFYKDEFDKLNNQFLYIPTNPGNVKPIIFNSVAITDTNFTYGIDEILERSKGLLNTTFPNLKETFKTGKPYSYLNLITSLNVTTAKVFLKHKLENLKVTRNQDFENYEDIKPFRKIEYFQNFKTYINLYIIDPYIDHSYLFQRLKKENFIEKIEHLEFSKWLMNKRFISEKIYKEISIKNGFYSLDKSKSGARVNNFKNIFLPGERSHREPY